MKSKRANTVKKGRNYKRSNRLKKNKRKLNKLIRATIIIFIAVVISTIALKSLNTMSLGTNKENNIDIKDNINIISDNKETSEEQNQLKEENINDNESNNKKIDSDEMVYLPLQEDINATDAREVQNRLTYWNYQREDNKKIAYLTFDDGPSEYVTDEILDVLKEKDVKATFFILGSMVDKNDYAKRALKRIVKEGHAIGNHGYCHRYDVLYPGGVVNADVFMDDMKKSEDAMKKVLGENFSTKVIRFPGGHGSWDTSTIDSVLEQDGYSYIDWNTLNGDAEGQGLSPDQLLARLQETVTDLEGNNDVIVILMHDTDAKESTAQYLGKAIDYLKSQGYEFKTLK